MTPNNEPVVWANLFPGLLSAVVFVTTAFDLWDPTEDQIQAISGLVVILVTVATAFARAKVWPTPHVDTEVATQVRQTAEFADLAQAEAEQAKATVRRLSEASASFWGTHQAPQAIAGPPPEPPLTAALPQPSRQVMGLLDPMRVGGRDPNSEGNT